MIFLGRGFLNTLSPQLKTYNMFEPWALSNSCSGLDKTNGATSRILTWSESFWNCWCSMYSFDYSWCNRHCHKNWGIQSLCSYFGGYWFFSPHFLSNNGWKRRISFHFGGCLRIVTKLLFSFSNHWSYVTVCHRLHPLKNAKKVAEDLQLIFLNNLMKTMIIQ